MQSVVSWLRAPAPCSVLCVAVPSAGRVCVGGSGQLPPTLLWAGLPEAAAAFLLCTVASQGLHFVSGTGGSAWYKSLKLDFSHLSSN